MKKSSFLLLIMAGWLSLSVAARGQIPTTPNISSEIWQQVQEKGTVRVTVGLNVPWQARKLNTHDEIRQRNDIGGKSFFLKAFR